jgi:hypothetical protein
MTRWDERTIPSRPVGVVPGGPDARLLSGRSEAQQRAREREYGRDVDRAAAAVLRQCRNGTDVGEFLVEVLRSAQDKLGVGYTLLDNRPGSWEASKVRDLMHAGGIL